MSCALGVCVAVGLWLILRSGSMAKDTPFTREFAAIHDLSTKLAHYAEDHATFSPGHSGESVNSLVKAAVLSASDAAYIREHHIQFRGFDPGTLGAALLSLRRYLRTPSRHEKLLATVTDTPSMWQSRVHHEGEQTRCSEPGACALVGNRRFSGAGIPVVTDTRKSIRPKSSNSWS